MMYDCSKDENSCGREEGRSSAMALLRRINPRKVQLPLLMIALLLCRRSSHLSSSRTSKRSCPLALSCGRADIQQCGVLDFLHPRRSGVAWVIRMQLPFAWSSLSCGSNIVRPRAFLSSRARCTTLIGRLWRRERSLGRACLLSACSHSSSLLGLARHCRSATYNSTQCHA